MTKQPAISEATRRVGILGGTFDPPHLAHLVLATNARHDLDLDEVLFVPAGDPYRKSDRAVSPPEARLRMVRSAVEDLSWASVETVEIERDGPTFTTDTLEQLAAAEGGDWWFILGTDALADLPHWRDPQRIVELVRLGLALRPGEFDGFEVPAPTRDAVPGIESRIDRIEMPMLEVSSTDLRARVRDGRPTDYLVLPPVRAVIDELGLYVS
jgi:nicotinate-nucleotide adenylyltransferase